MFNNYSTFNAKSTDPPLPLYFFDYFNCASPSGERVSPCGSSHVACASPSEAGGESEAQGRASDGRARELAPRAVDADSGRTADGKRGERRGCGGEVTKIRELEQKCNNTKEIPMRLWSGWRQGEWGGRANIQGDYGVDGAKESGEGRKGEVGLKEGHKVAWLSIIQSLLPSFFLIDFLFKES